jgi:HD-GYP domain-containing protein (c-di-GMP phosphodiesterase class II)
VKKKVPVADLQFGMYVYELDRPWSETPFVFQRFVLKTQQQVDGLRKHCKHVFVDTVGEPTASVPVLRPGSGPVAADLQGTGKVVHVERVSVESEFALATETYSAAMTVIKGAFDAIRPDEALDSGELKLAVGNMTESMLRNPNAMVLLSALQERGGYHLGRALSVSIHMIAFTRFLGMDEEVIERAGLVGLLQDVGMLKVPQRVREKEGRLSPQEFALVQAHVATTTEQLRGTPGLSPEIAEIAALHHERHDGSGYPHGKKGDSLGVLGAIAGIVDVFDALTTKRPYAEPMSPSNALNVLQKQRDKAFHPVLVEQFVRCIGFFPVGSVVELNSGETGIVISHNQVKRLLPRVMVVRDAQGQLLRPQKLLDLAKMPKIGKDEPYRIRRTLEYGRAEVTAKDIMMA